MSTLDRQAYRAQNWRAFGAAFSLEALAVGGLLIWWVAHPTAPPLRILPLEIVAPSPELAPAPPPPKVQPSEALPPQQHRQAPAPPIAAPAPAPITPAPAPVAPEPEAAATSPTQALVAALAAPPVPPPSPASTVLPTPSAKYIARVHVAVQAAFVYPPAAAAAGFQGKTRVAFTLHGLVPVGIRVLVGSGMAMVDRAALRSIQAASYPPPPPEMKGADINVEVWVELEP